MLRIISKEKGQKKGFKYFAVLAMSLGILFGSAYTAHAWTFVSTSGCHGSWRSSSSPLVSETIANFTGCEAHASVQGASFVQSGWRVQGAIARAASDRNPNGNNFTWWNLRSVR